MINPFTKFSGAKLFGFHLSLILLLSILVVLPIFIDGIPSSTDIPEQYQFIQLFYDSIKEGSFYPNWSHLSNYGYGDVRVRFYPPFAYYIFALCRGVAGNWFDASLLFFLLGYFVSGLGVYWWSREWFSANASLAAGLVYIILPYHLIQIYIGALFAEFTAAAILPFCFLFITRICQKGRSIDIVGLGLTFGLLIITHIPTTIIASLTFVVYVLFTLKKAEFIKSLAKLFASVIIGLVLSSFFWMRLISELNYIRFNSQAYMTGYYSYKTEFVFSFLFPFADIHHSSPTTLMSLATLATIGILLPSGIFYFLRRKEFPINNVLAMTGFALIMATPLSLKIWEYVPFLQKIQFPFRWLTLFSLGSAIIVAAGFKGLSENLKTPKRYLSWLAIGILLICLPYNYFQLMTPFITYPKDFFLTVLNGFKVAPSGEHWWSAWATKATGEQTKFTLVRPAFIADKVVLNQRTFEVKSWTATDRIFSLSEGESGQASIATSYYPHWKATVNGQPVEVSPSEIGLISFPVPSEKAEVRVFFEEPKLIKTAYFVSGLGWLMLLISFLLYLFFRRKKSVEKADVAKII